MQIFIISLNSKIYNYNISTQKNKELTGESANSLLYFMVPKTGFEPAREVPPPPQDGVSTNSTTSALREVYLLTGAAGGMTGSFAVFGFAAGSCAAFGFVTGIA